MHGGVLTPIDLSTLTNLIIAVLNLLIFVLWVHITLYYVGLIITLSRYIIDRANIYSNTFVVLAANGRWAGF